MAARRCALLYYALVSGVAVALRHAPRRAVIAAPALTIAQRVRAADLPTDKAALFALVREARAQLDPARSGVAR